jgi:glycoside/pentoside/hexuronide:cation symporter, GPH family
MGSGTVREKVALPRILAFAAPSLPLAALGLPFVVHLPAYYANQIGLSVGLVGMIFMLARLADIGVDLAVGLAMDQTRTRWGRFTPWLVAGAPLLSLGVWFVFMAPTGTPQQPGVSGLYLAVFLFLTYCAFSMGTLSQMSLGATLSDDYHERSRVFVFWQMGNIVGMLLVLALPVIAYRMGGDTTAGIQAMGWFIIVLMPLTALLAAAFAREAPPRAERQPTDFGDFRALLKSDACRRLLGADLLLMYSSGVTGGLFIFFFTAAKGYSSESANLFMLVYFVVGLISAPLWTLLARRTAKHISLATACVFVALSQPLLLLLPENNVPVVSLAMAGAGIVYAAPAYLLRAMMADVGDEDLLATGKDRTGLLYAMVTLTGKAGFAFAVGTTYLVLGLVGFEATRGAGNDESALVGLEAMFMAVPVVCSLISLLMLRGYPVDAARVSEMQAELSLRREAPGAIPGTNAPAARGTASQAAG